MIDHKDISSEERLDECIEIVTIKKTDYLDWKDNEGENS